jgi:hypothetical protein
MLRICEPPDEVLKNIEFSETEVDYASHQSITRFSKKGIYFSTL